MVLFLFYIIHSDLVGFISIFIEGVGIMKLRSDRLQSARAAVVVVDVQNDYCHTDGALGRRGANLSMVNEMILNLNRLLYSARKNHVPVIFVRTHHQAETNSEAWKSRSDGRSTQNCLPGSWGADFFQVAPLDTETVVTKHRYSAFIHTRFESVLRAMRVETLIMTGVSTNVCVESTARDGFMLDYHIVLPQDACAAYSKPAHDMTLYNIDKYFGSVTSTEDVIKHWETAHACPSEANK
jgi:ureidoacrylate peracid hydrolase